MISCRILRVCEVTQPTFASSFRADAPIWPTVPFRPPHQSLLPTPSRNCRRPTSVRFWEALMAPVRLPWVDRSLSAFTAVSPYASGEGRLVSWPVEAEVIGVILGP